MKFKLYSTKNQGLVNIQLADGDTHNEHCGGPTDEGYHWEAVSIEHCGHYLKRVDTTQAADCDGRLDTHSESTWCLSSGEVRDNGTLVWEKVSASQRDQFAEKAGY